MDLHKTALFTAFVLFNEELLVDVIAEIAWKWQISIEPTAFIAYGFCMYIKKGDTMPLNDVRVNVD